MPSPVVTAPSNQEIVTQSAAYTIKVYAPDDASVGAYADGSLLGAMTNAGGGNWTYSWTPASVVSSVLISAVGNVSGASASMVVTVAETNAITSTMTSWSTSGISISVASGITHPDGTGTVYEAKPSASGTAARYFVQAASPAPTTFASGYEIWVGTKSGSVTNCIQFNFAAGGGYYNFLTGESTAGDNYMAVVETRIVGGITWQRLQHQRLSTAPSAQASIFHYLTKDFTGTSVNITSGELAGSGIYVCDPRWVGKTSLPLTVAQKMSAHYGSTTSGVERWYYKHPYADTEANMSGGAYPGGIDIYVMKPTGWTYGSAQKVLYALPALLESTETSVGNPTLVSTMTTCNAHNLYNALVVIPFDRGGSCWWGKKADGTANYHDVVAFAIRSWVIRMFGINSNRNNHLLIGYSKSAWAAQSLMLRHNDKFGFAAGWDSPLSGAYPNNGTPDAFTTEANFNAYDPVQILSTYGASNKDRRRLILMGWNTFQSEMTTFTSALTSNGIPYYLRMQSEARHSWGPTTWTPIAIEQLFKLSSVALNQGMFLVG